MIEKTGFNIRVKLQYSALQDTFKIGMQKNCSLKIFYNDCDHLVLANKKQTNLELYSIMKQEATAH